MICSITASRQIFLRLLKRQSLNQRWSPHVVVSGPCVQGSEWPSTSRVILCQWRTLI